MPTPEQVIGRMGRAIAQRRQELGISQNELGIRSGFHRCTIVTIETGKRNLAMDSIQRLANALEIPGWKLYYFAEIGSKKASR